MNFYDDLISEIEEKLKNNKLNESLKLIEEEINMPFVPNNIENKLLKLRDIIYSKQKDLFEKKDFTFKDIYNFLNNDKISFLEKQDLIIFLENYNLNKYKKEIEELFLDKKLNILIKIKLIFILKDQNFQKKNIKIFYENKIKEYLLEEFIPIEEDENYSKDKEKIEKFLLQESNILEHSLLVLKDFYLKEGFVDKKINNYWKEVLFFSISFFGREDLQSKILKTINDEEKFQKKLKKIIKII